MKFALSDRNPTTMNMRLEGRKKGFPGGFIKLCLLVGNLAIYQRNN